MVPLIRYPYSNHAVSGCWGTWSQIIHECVPFILYPYSKSAGSRLGLWGTWSHIIHECVPLIIYPYSKSAGSRLGGFHLRTLQINTPAHPFFCEEWPSHITELLFQRDEAIKFANSLPSDASDSAVTTIGDDGSAADTSDHT